MTSTLTNTIVDQNSATLGSKTRTTINIIHHTIYQRQGQDICLETIYKNDHLKYNKTIPYDLNNNDNTKNKPLWPLLSSLLSNSSSKTFEVTI